MTSGSLSDVARLCGGVLHEKSQANESAWLACVTAPPPSASMFGHCSVIASFCNCRPLVLLVALQRARRDACGAHRLGACEHHDRRCIRCSRRGRSVGRSACRALLQSADISRQHSTFVPPVSGPSIVCRAQWLDGLVRRFFVHCAASMRGARGQTWLLRVGVAHAVVLAIESRG